MSSNASPNAAANPPRVGTLSGILKAATGVISTATAGSDYVIPSGSITGQSGTVATIAGLIAEGSNVTITGAGTTASPYSIAATGGGGGTPGGSTGAVQYNNDGALGGSTTVSIATNGTLCCAGTIDESTTFQGVILGAGQSGRVLFSSGVSGQTWEIDAEDGIFRWYQPGYLYMTLVSSGGGTLTVKTIAGQSVTSSAFVAEVNGSSTANLYQCLDSVGTTISALDYLGAFRPPSMADSTANAGTLYYSTTAGKLVYKDSSGVVNNLY
jgi:hypothetical protein